MPQAGLELALLTPKLPHSYAIYLAATGIGDCRFTSLKMTDWEGKFYSEMNISIAQMKAMCECTLLECGYHTYVV